MMMPFCVLFPVRINLPHAYKNLFAKDGCGANWLASRSFLCTPPDSPGLHLLMVSADSKVL